MSDPFDELLGKYQQPTPAVPAVPLNSSDPFDQLLNQYQTPSTQPKKPDAFAQFWGNAFTTVTSPLQAPQQALFGVGNILAGGFSELLQGRRGAFAEGLGKAQRAGEAALGYASFGLIGSREKAVLGRDLFKQVGAPEWMQTWGGFAADVLADPSNLLGGAGVAAKAAKLTKAGDKLLDASRAVERIGNVYRAPENVLRATDRVARAFGVQTDLTGAAGRGLREVAGRVLDNPSSKGFTPSELFLPDALKQRILPQETATRVQALRDIGQRADAIAGQFDLELKKVYDGFGEATKGLTAPQKAELDAIMYRNQAATTNAALQKAQQELQDFATRTGDTTLVPRVQKAYQQATTFDAWAGSKLQGVGYAARGAQSGQDMAAKVRRGFLLYGDGGEAFIQKILATPKPASVTDLQRLTTRAQRAGVDNQFAQGLEGVLKANPDLTLGEALVQTRTQLNLSSDDTQKLFDAILERPRGFGVELDNVSAARRLTGLRDGITEGAKRGKPGIGEAIVTQRQLLDDDLLREYGEIESVLAQYERQGDNVGQLVSAKQALLETRDLIAQEAGGRVFKFGDVDLPRDIAESITRGDGKWRRVTPELKDKLGVFETDEIIPAWYHRSLQAQSLFQTGGVVGGALTTIMRANNIWKTVKLSNPASIMRNVFGGVIQAENGVTVAGKSYRVNPLEMAQGLARYFRRSEQDVEEAVNAGLNFSAFSADEIKRAGDEITARLAGSKGKGLNPLNAVLSFFEEASGARPGALDGAGGVAGEAARAVAKYNPVSAAGRLSFKGFSGTEEIMKGAIYFALKSKVGAATAATVAEETLFNYAARPLAVSVVSKLGIDPFATFKAFAVGRTIENLYDRPAALARMARAPQAFTDAVQPDRGQQRQERMSMPEWMREKLPIPIGGKDENGRQYFLPLLDLLPGGAFVNALDDSNSTGIPGVGGFVSVPPVIQLYNEVIQGIGFQGRQTYQGLGSSSTGATSLKEALEGNPGEATRRAIKTTLNFVGYPWQPGSPMMDRLAQALTSRLRTADDLAVESGAKDGESFTREAAEFALRTLSQGALQFEEGADPVLGGTIKSDGKGNYGVEPAQNLESTVGRLAGFTTYPVQPNTDQLGSARTNQSVATNKVQAVENYWKRRIRELTLKGASQQALQAAQNRAQLEIEKARGDAQRVIDGLER
jgi:hypothetical protein